MIFQIPIDLEIEGKDVQVIFDLDTGVFGFTELINNKTIEYYYGESPIEFKKALIDKLEPILAKKNLINFKICRKNEKMKTIRKYLSEKEL